MGSVTYVYKMVRISLLSQLALRSSYYFGLLREFLFLILSIQLFRTLYSGSETVISATLKETITYLIISKFAQFFNMSTMGKIQSRIVSGEIATDLLRPVEYDFFMLVQEFGAWIQRVISITLPLVLLSLLFVKFYPPSTIYYGFFFIICILLSFLIMFYANYCVSLTAFWIPYLWSLNSVSTTLFTILSGAMIPLWFYPEGIRSVLEWLPFSLAVYTPINVYLGRIYMADMPLLFLKQAMWIVILWLVSRFIWSRATKKIIVNGG